MKNLFYGILVFILLMCLFIIFKFDKQLENKKFNNAIVIEKDDDYMLGESLTVKYPDGSIRLELVYQIFYDKYEVGDTIKCK